MTPQASQAQTLHPLFADILRPVLSATADLKAAELYHPSIGNTRRLYQSVGGVFSYEAGYLAYRCDAPAPTIRTPFADGWSDAKDADCGGEATP